MVNKIKYLKEIYLYFLKNGNVLPEMLEFLYGCLNSNNKGIVKGALVILTGMKKEVILEIINRYPSLNRMYQDMVCIMLMALDFVEIYSFFLDHLYLIYLFLYLKNYKFHASKLLKHSC